LVYLGYTPKGDRFEMKCLPDKRHRSVTPVPDVHRTAVQRVAKPVENVFHSLNFFGH